MHIAEVKGLRYSGFPHRDRYILEDVSFSLEKGEYLTILGNSHSGRAELVRHLNALLKPDSGCVTVCGFDAAQAQNEKAIREKCAMVFCGAQEHFVCRTVGEETAFALRNYGRDGNISAALEKVGFRGHENTALFTLERLDAVRVSTAAAIAIEPELIIFDNSLSPLGNSDKREMRKRIRKLHEEGMSVILASDNAEDAADAERTIVMHEGRIIADGDRQQVFSDKAIFDTAQLAVPFAVRAYFDLLDAEIRLDRVPLTEDELVDEICR